MARFALLSDRSPAEIPAAISRIAPGPVPLRLSAESFDRAVRAGCAAILIDARDDPAAVGRILDAVGVEDPPVPVLALLEPEGLDGFEWDQRVDDVLVSTAGPAEVRFRLAGALRRGAPAGPSTLRLGPLVLDAATYRVEVAGRRLDLTYREFELLRFLIAQPDRVFTRAELLKHVWGYDFYGGTRTVDVHVRRLRAKLGPAHESVLQTVRGVGYRAAAPGDRPARPGDGAGRD